ncbi:MAG TPA: HdeD family acid-resistance protein [Burkholderiaceae bacterium]|nr:HdeD family acid-resistance protein [Burkholderiaceae bacterium]
MQSDMLRYLENNWGWIVLRGVAGVLFAVLAVAWPGVTLAALVIVWGAYALADGILALVAAWLVRDAGRPFGWLIVVGLLGIAAGVVTFLWPGITAMVLLMLIAAWAFAMGIFQIAAAIRLRKVIEGEWMLLLSGVLSVAFGVLMAIYPGAGALAMLWQIAAFALVFGTLLIALGFRLRSRAAHKPAAA